MTQALFRLSTVSPKHQSFRLSIVSPTRIPRILSKQPTFNFRNYSPPDDSYTDEKDCCGFLR